MREPLLLPLAAIAAGILLGKFLEFSVFAAAWPVAAFSVLGAAGMWGEASRWLRWVAALLALGFAGILAGAWHRPGPAPQIDAGARETVILSGCVVEPSVFSVDREQFTLELEPGARARVTLPIDAGDAEPGSTEPGLTEPPSTAGSSTNAPSIRLHYGQRVEIEARIRPPRNFRNPGAFDYARYLARRDIYWTASMSGKNNPSARVLSGRCGSRMWAVLYSLREAALDRLELLYGRDGYTSGMMQAILIGENAKLEKIWTEDFRRTGTVHALVISGAHVAVLAGVLLLMLRLCAFQEIAALGIATLGAWLYAFVSGFSPPVARAAAGFSLYLVARFFFRKARVLNVLSAIAIVYLLADPEELFDPSFQLSFLAAAALGALGTPLIALRLGPLSHGLRQVANSAIDPHLDTRAAQLRVEVRLAAEALQYWTRIPRRWLVEAISLVLRILFYGAELFLLSAVMQVGLALPMALYFHRMSFTGLTANLFIVPLLETAVPVGFLAIFTGWRWLAGFARWLLQIAATTASWHAGWEPSLRVPDPPPWLAVGFAAALIATACALRRRRMRVAATAFAIGLFVLMAWHPWRWKATQGMLEMTAIDVGQGDSILIGLPEGGTMLIDGGGVLTYGKRLVKPRLDTGEDVVSPYLWSRGLRRLDVLVVTHAHADHAGGIAALLSNFRPSEVWFGSNPPEALVKQARGLGIRTEFLRTPDAREISGARIEVLSPPVGFAAAMPGNNDSLAFRVSYGERSFLLTGDMERPMERRLANDPRVRADVLKVGHHGSRTSTTEEFLDAVSPKVAVISAGFQNSFGHPHRDVLGRLGEHRVTILRTDDDGLVTVRTDGHRLWMDGAMWGLGEPATSSGSGGIVNAK